ncbi:hypothetical protein DFH08DRAFT_845236 [Mycena albidolilacea]|uniref:F-box domain-containing protein n=1 Tax=Mycena albidolilacea TaxID=1033008 RepID=A0AAD7F0I6_9AGAR|nr:hypothetical protein DFH08DRAFT_845236 [Mycena albidolilacea]
MLFARLRKKLSSVIHRKHHRDVETSRAREHNTIYDPMARLPFEISSYIFMHCLPRSPRPNRHEAPLIFLNVCRFWSFIALSTPSLWAAVSFPLTNPGQAKSAKKYFEIWLGRAGDHPLSLRVSSPGFLDGRVDVGLKQYAHQMQSLELSVYSRELDAITTPFPSLKKLAVSVFDSTDCISRFIAILGGSPLLVECELRMVYLGVQSRVVPESLTHLSLRCLRLNSRNRPTRSTVYSAQILRHLTLPVLESLIVTIFDISAADLHSFLARSAPPLKFLDIKAWDPSWSEICDWSHLVPSLTDLVFECWNVQELSLHRLCILPNLCNLVVNSDASMLRHLTLPVLESLIITDPYIPTEEFLSFLARSSPLLRSLDIGFFPRLPDLWTSEIPVVPFLQLMASQDLLPHLQSLTIRPIYPHRDLGKLYDDLVELLKTRFASRQCTQLQSVSVIFKFSVWEPGRMEREETDSSESEGADSMERGGTAWEGTNFAPDDDTIAALRQFVGAGVHIHVGPKSHNYI